VYVPRNCPGWNRNPLDVIFVAVTKSVTRIQIVSTAKLILVQPSSCRAEKDLCSPARVYTDGSKQKYCTRQSQMTLWSSSTLPKLWPSTVRIHRFHLSMSSIPSTSSSTSAGPRASSTVPATLQLRMNSARSFLQDCADPQDKGRGGPGEDREGGKGRGDKDRSEIW
jgi:hypothetical protein